MSQSFQTWNKQGTTFHLVPTDKFKTTTVLVTFSAPLEEKTLTRRADGACLTVRPAFFMHISFIL